MTVADPPQPPPSTGRRRILPYAALAAALVLLAVVLVVVVTRPKGSPSDAEVMVPLGGAVGAEVRIQRLVPKDGTLLGSWTSPNEKATTAAVQTRLFDQRERLVGRPFDIAHDFHSFDEPFPSAQERAHLKAGRIPMISWNGTSAADIVHGKYDAMIRKRARAVKALGAPVFLRFWWEMDTEQKKAWAPQPGQFVAAWRHVHQLFDDEGTSNVAWVWCPTSLAFNKDAADRWWPGDGWVDWVCADGYNFAPAKPKVPWRTFAEIFDPFYTWAVAKQKPIMIGEFGVLERDPGEKAAWLRQAAEDLDTRFPQIKAVVYFDTRRTVDGKARDWRIDTSPGSTKAFQELARSLGERVRRR